MEAYNGHQSQKWIMKKKIQIDTKIKCKILFEGDIQDNKIDVGVKSD